MAKDKKTPKEKNVAVETPKAEAKKTGVFGKLFSSKNDKTDYEYSQGYDYSNSNGHSKRTVRLVGDESNFAMREAYKSGRTNIVFALPEEESSVVLVTSSWPMEGKTTNCANLSVAFAQTGAKTLLIDCDLRKPRIHKIFKVEKKVGLTNVLRKFCTVEEAIFNTSYENLDILASGHIPPNPGELLGSDEMKELIEELKKTYRYIIIDTPPVNMVSDAIILSPVISGVALVVRQGITDHKSVTEALDKMNFAGVKTLGFILNDASDSQGNYYKDAKRYKKRNYYKGYYKNYYGRGYYGKSPETSKSSLNK